MHNPAIKQNLIKTWRSVLFQTARRYHTIGAWVAAILNPIWAISDYYIIPEHWKIFFLIRLAVSSLTLAALLLQKKLKIRHEILVGIPFLGIALQNAYMYSVMDAEVLHHHTFAYIALFIGGGMLILWEVKYTIFVITITLLANIILFLLFGHLSLSEILINGGLLTFTVAVFSILLIETRYRLTKREIKARLALAHSNRKLEKQKNIIQQANKQITSSILYAKNIQQAILPDLNIIRNELKNSFIFYRPKDIVSGDFYWFTKLHHQTIIAAVDCTGHGVPGALMSMIGSSMLDKIVIENHITEPGAILASLNTNIIKSLKQNEQSNKDGMDIAICSIDRENSNITFAGAHNPLYLIRNGALTELKGEKAPIGFSYKDNVTFNNQNLPIKAGDIIYMFTDGFPDQFGGPKNKKFSYKRFKELLISISHLPIEKQEKALHDTFQEWKSQYEQTDDVCVIGFRI